MARERIGAEVQAGIEVGPVVHLERTVSRLTGRLVWGRSGRDMVSLAAGEGVIVFHAGPETAVRPGIPASLIKTGRELVIVEMAFGENHYHLWGGVDRTSRNYKLTGMDVAQDGRGYKRARRVNLEVVQDAVRRLKMVEMLEKKLI